MLEPSFTDAGALKVADGATLFTVRPKLVELLAGVLALSVAVIVTVWL
jgi:hypothetical protein